MPRLALPSVLRGNLPLATSMALRIVGVGGVRRGPPLPESERGTLGDARERDLSPKKAIFEGAPRWGRSKDKQTLCVAGKKKNTQAVCHITLDGGSLGSQIDEERSQLCEAWRIAGLHETITG